LENNHLHIVAFDVPYPANYGGVIDIFYKIKSLHAKGVKIHLHCFEYGRAQAIVLESICYKVYYYKRKMSKQHLLNALPFVVVTRSSEKLVQTLLHDNHPILFEGLHCCFHLNDERLSKRTKVVRMHNIEHDYYKSLEQVEKSFFRKIYFGIEAKKLKKFEKVLNKATAIVAISNQDTEQLAKHYKNVTHITAFHPYTQVKIEEGKGTFCLYHGNLEVGENNKAALFLIEEVFSKLQIPFIIAGRKPSTELVIAVAKYAHIKLKANIPTQEIDALINTAQINVLPTFQATGIKLKLLAALFNGRFCVVNSPMVVNTGLEDLCTIVDTSEEMISAIKHLFEMNFEMSNKVKREDVLNNDYSNLKSVDALIDILKLRI
jgi:Glycosyl transferases group 1